MVINTSGVLDGTTVHSNLTLSVASRSQNSVTFNYSITTYLNASGSTSAGYETYTGAIVVSGANITTTTKSVVLKPLNEGWSGATQHTVTGSFTVNTSTYTNLTASVSYTTTSSRDATHHGTGNGTISTGSGQPSLAPSNVTASASVTAGNNLSVTVTPASNFYSVSHTITIYIGNTVIATETTPAATTSQTVSVAIPISAANLIPSAMSGQATITVATISNGTAVGAKSTTTTVNVPSYTLSGTVTATPINQFSGSNLQNYTSLSVEASGVSNYGATVSYVCTFNGATYNTATFTTSAVTSSGDVTVAVVMTDSRGKTATVNSTALTFLAYNPPIITEVSAQRNATTPSNVAVVVKGTYSPLDGSNTATANVSLAGNTATGTDTTASFNITVNTTANELYSYEGTVYVSDTVGGRSSSIAFSLTSKAVQIDLHNSGKGVAIGKVSETADLFEVGYNAQFNGTVNIGEVELDYIVEQGTDGVWTYEKWNSGKAVCYGRISVYNVPMSAWGNIFSSGANSKGNTAFPFSFVGDVPDIHWSVISTAVSFWIMEGETARPNLPSLTQTGDVGMLRASNTTISNAVLGCLAIGKWK